MRTFQSRWSNGLLWVVEIRKLLASHSSCENMTLRLRTSFIISAWNFAAELQANLQEFIASGIVEVRENGGCIASFSGMSWAVRGDGEKPLPHLWSEPFTLTRPVLSIPDHSESRPALVLQRLGLSSR